MPDFQAGQRQLSASALNALTAVVRDRNAPEVNIPQTFVQNKTGSDQAEFAVYGLGDSVKSKEDAPADFFSNPLVEGNTPTTAVYTSKFGVCLRKCLINAFAPVVVTGIVAVQIDITDTDHTHADVKNGDTTQLASGFSGSALIIWKPAGTGTKWCLVNLGGGSPIGATPDSFTHLAAITTTETANSGTWDANDATGLKLRTFRYTYVFDGDEISYGFYRDTEYTVDGRVLSVSAETRFVVDTPGACP